MTNASAFRGDVSTGRRVTTAWSAVDALARWWMVLVGALVAGAVIDTVEHHPAVGFEMRSAVAVLAVAALTGAAAMVDLHEHRIPNRLLGWSSFIVGVALIGSDIGAVLAVAAGLLGAAVPMIVVRLHRGIGMGDVKLAGVLGAAGGLVHPSLGVALVFVAALASGLYGALRGIRRLALGPWLWTAWSAVTTAALVHLVLVSGG